MAASTTNVRALPHRPRTMKQPPDLFQKLAHQDANIELLDEQFQTLKADVRSLQGEVHTGFSEMQTGMQEVKGMMAQFNVRPSFDLQKIATTTLVVATLLSMCIGTIVWVNVLQTSAIVAKVEGQQALVTYRLEQAEKDIRYLGRRIHEKGE